MAKNMLFGLNKTSGCIKISVCHQWVFELPQTGWLNQHLLLTILGAGSPNQGTSVVKLLTRALLLDCRWLPSCSVLIWWSVRLCGTHSGLLTRAIIPSQAPHPYELI